jgi:glycosyltransferase involved in cell wall biosynthesis
MGDSILDLSLVIPACNEEGRIGGTLTSYFDFLNGTDIKYEVIVEMDGCRDQTAFVVQELKKEYPAIKVIEFHDKLGKGGGLLKGFRVARGKYVGFVDADGSVQPDQLLKVYKEAKEGCDGAIASRRVANADVINQLRSRRIMGRCFNLLIRLLFALPYRDTQCGAKVFKREVLEQALSDAQINGFAFDVSLLYLITLKGYEIKEVGIRWEERDGSRVDIPHTTADMLSSVLMLRLLFSPLGFLLRKPNINIYNEKERELS